MVFEQAEVRRGLRRSTKRALSCSSKAVQTGYSIRRVIWVEWTRAADGDLGSGTVGHGFIGETKQAKNCSTLADPEPLGLQPRNWPPPAKYALTQIYLIKTWPRGERPFHIVACGGAALGSNFRSRRSINSSGVPGPDLPSTTTR